MRKTCESCGWHLCTPSGRMVCCCFDVHEIAVLPAWSCEKWIALCQPKGE